MTNEKLQALKQFLNLNEEEAQELQVSSYNDNIIKYYSEEYEILTDEEADERWEEELQYYIDEYILSEIPKFCQRYFDEEAWKRDARFDGRGHSISHYDGCENEEKVNGTWYYIYRQN